MRSKDEIRKELGEAKEMLAMAVECGPLSLVEGFEDEVRALESELDTATILNLVEGFKHLNQKELMGMVNSSNVDWKVKEAAKTVLFF